VKGKKTSLSFPMGIAGGEGSPKIRGKGDFPYEIIEPKTQCLKRRRGIASPSSEWKGAGKRDYQSEKRDIGAKLSIKGVHKCGARPGKK